MSDPKRSQALEAGRPPTFSLHPTPRICHSLYLMKDKTMNRMDLFNEVKGWLEAGKLRFTAYLEDTDFELRMNLDNCLIQVRIICEEDPASLQIIGTLPVKVPAEKFAEAALFLHNLNATLRIGSFQLQTESRIIAFRLPLPVHPEADLAEQFGAAVSMTLNTMNDHLPSLALVLCSTAKAREGVARFQPAAKTKPARKMPAGPSPRFELN